MRKARPEGGFLLLEVLLATVIAALAVVALLGVATGGLRATGLASRYSQAVARARSHLAAVGARVAPLTPGREAGDDGSGFRWEVEIEPISRAAFSATPGRALVLYRIRVTESWQSAGSERRIVLTSARLGTARDIGP